MGQWFEETLSPGDVLSVESPDQSDVAATNDASSADKLSQRHSSSDSFSQLPDKKEPDAVSPFTVDQVSVTVFS